MIVYRNINILPIIVERTGFPKYNRIGDDNSQNEKTNYTLEYSHIFCEFIPILINGFLNSKQKINPKINNASFVIYHLFIFKRTAIEKKNTGRIDIMPPVQYPKSISSLLV